MSFEKLSASFISEQLNREHRNVLHGDEEALVVSHKHGGSSNQAGEDDNGEEAHHGT